MTPSATPSSSSSFLEKYKGILAKHLSDLSNIRAALTASTEPDQCHPLWKDLAALMQSDDNNNDNNTPDLQTLLNAVHDEQQQGAMYPLPSNAVQRAAPKKAERVRDKIAPMPTHRSNYCDWMACRIMGHYDQFSALKDQLEDSFSHDTVVVWRYNYEDPTAHSPDIMHMGYAYRPGALAILEIQIVEPIAAWVFTSNSLNKHAPRQMGRVTFKESKDLYNQLKTAIIQGTVPPTDAAKNVVAYYEAKRQEKGDESPLDLQELAKFQQLINERFDFTNNTTAKTNGKEDEPATKRLRNEGA